MARKPRIHVPGGVYHVMLRGNGGQDIFFSKADRYHLYLLLQQGIERYRQTGAGTLAEMGAHFNRDATTLSRQVGRIELEPRSSAGYAKDMNKHINALTQA